MALWEDPAAREEREQKKFNRIMRNAVIYAGIGIGLLLVRPFFSGTTETPDLATATLFNSAGLALLIYGGLIVASGLFLRKMLFKIYLVAHYGLLPLAIIKALMDWQS
ncbi:MAG: hypothetical protein NDJ24_03735 [Alphaproteobacteria bacterium]|nr:hypothetical protein [Alphaproteobacteria bacterium]